MTHLALILAVAAPGELVHEIRVEGLVAVAPEVALEGTETRVGDALDDDALTRDVRVLWGKGLFSDVQVEKQRRGVGWVVTFRVRERPLVRRILFGGNDTIEDEDLLDVIRSAPFREPIDQTAANADARRIEEHYFDEGFSRAQVAVRLEMASEPGQADLMFDIREGPRAYITELSIDGNVDLTDEEILEILQSCEATLLNRLVRACWYNEDWLQTDLYRIQALYYDRGYVNVEVDVPEVSFSGDGDGVVIRVPVRENGQFFFGRIEFSVDGVPPVFPVEKLQRLLDVAEGSVFNRTRLFNGIERIQAAYRWELGTIVAVSPESDVDMEGHRVDLVLTIESPEPRYPSAVPGTLLPEQAKPL